MNTKSFSLLIYLHLRLLRFSLHTKLQAWLQMPTGRCVTSKRSTCNRMGPVRPIDCIVLDILVGVVSIFIILFYFLFFFCSFFFLSRSTHTYIPNVSHVLVCAMVPVIESCNTCSRHSLLIFYLPPTQSLSTVHTIGVYVRECKRYWLC